MILEGMKSIMFATIRFNAKLDTYIVSLFRDEQTRVGVVHVTDEDKVGVALKRLADAHCEIRRVISDGYAGFDHIPAEYMHCVTLAKVGE